jgi:hypothetical protein
MALVERRQDAVFLFSQRLDGEHGAAAVWVKCKNKELPNPQKGRESQILSGMEWITPAGNSSLGIAEWNYRYV